MSDTPENKPITRSKTNHVPPWPLFAAILFLIVIVVVGIIASNAGHKSVGSDPDCSSTQYLASVRDRAGLSTNVGGNLKEPQFYRCRGNFGYALLTSRQNDQSGGTAWFKYNNGRWDVLYYGEQPVADPVKQFGIAPDVVAYLTGAPLTVETSTTSVATTAAGSTATTLQSPSVTGTTPAVDKTACTTDNLLLALQASDSVSPEIIAGGVTWTRFKCSDGYAYAFIEPARADQQPAYAYFKVDSGKWKLLSLGGEVGDGTDVGVPKDVSAKLRA